MLDEPQGALVPHGSKRRLGGLVLVIVLLSLRMGSASLITGCGSMMREPNFKSGIASATSSETVMSSLGPQWRLPVSARHAIECALRVWTQRKAAH